MPGSIRVVDQIMDSGSDRISSHPRACPPPDVTIAVLSVLSSVFIVVSSVLGNSLEFAGFT